MKTCPTCQESKPLDSYWKGQSYCIECTKEKQKNRWHSRTPKKRLEQHLRYKYGLSHQEFLAAFKEQNGCCAICLHELPDLESYDQRRRHYAIDHDHVTNKFRGILCTGCNSLLGLSGDSIEILTSAINYLQTRGSYNRKTVDNARAARSM